MIYNLSLYLLYITIDIFVKLRTLIKLDTILRMLKFRLCMYHLLIPVVRRALSYA